MKQFEGVEFNTDDMAAYVEFWAPYMEEMNISDEQKNELAKAWQILAINYAKNVENINKKHVNFNKVCWDVFAYVMDNSTKEVDWNVAFDVLIRFYPPRLFARMLDKDNVGALRRKVNVIEFIGKQVLRHLEKPEVLNFFKKME